MFLLPCKQHICVYIYMYIFFCTPGIVEIPLLPFVEIGMGSSLSCCLFFSWTACSHWEPFSCFLWILQFPFSRHLYLFHLSSLWQSSISLSCFHYGRCAFSLFFSAPWERLLFITHPILTDWLQPLQRSEQGVRFMSISLPTERSEELMDALWISRQQGNTAKQSNRKLGYRQFSFCDQKYKAC